MTYWSCQTALIALSSALIFATAGNVGLQAVLDLSLTNTFKLAGGSSNTVVALFVAAAAFASPVVAWLACGAGRNRPRTAYVGSIAFALVGAAFLCIACTLPCHQLPLVVVALVFASVGYGGANTLQPVLVAKLTSEHVFSGYYLMYNVGCIIGEYGMPFLRHSHGTSAAFIAIAVAEVVAVILAAWALFGMLPWSQWVKLDGSDADRALVVHPADSEDSSHADGERPACRMQGRSQQATKVFSLCMLVTLMSVYWSLLNQMSDAWVLQGHRLSQNKLLPPDAMPSVNDLLDVTMLALLQTPCGKAFQQFLPPSARFCLGLGCMVPTYLCVFALQMCIHTHGSPARPYLMWQIPQYVFVSVADVLTVPAALELAYCTTAGKKQGVYVSLVYLAQCFGNLLDSVIFVTPVSLKWQFCASLILAVLATISAVASWRFPCRSVVSRQGRDS